MTAISIVESVRRGTAAPEAAVAASRARIEALDGALEAWVHVDGEGALAAAAALGALARDEIENRPLAGVPVGVKDIFDVAGQPTRLGAGAFAHSAPGTDAAVVARLRAAGAVILGKTATTAFAFQDPAPTRNPWNREYTPGGSSSGSAAAVAAGMVPLALGSQTVGSVLRPAAFCGIVGLKPSFGRSSTRGVFPLAPSLDHVGIFATTVADAALVLSVIAGPDPADPHSVEAPLDDYLAAATVERPPPLLGFPRSFLRDAADDEVAVQVEAVAERLRAAGATIKDLDMPLRPRETFDLGQPVMRAEAAAAHADLFAANRDVYPPRFRDFAEAGLRETAVAYLQARVGLHRLRWELLRRLEGVDALLLPVAPTTAPRGFATTGDPVFCAPATYTGLPAIALPSGLSDSGLPLALQLVGAPFAEAALLGVAAWTERVLDFQARPPLG